MGEADGKQTCDLGIAIVTYQSADIITQCLDSLAASDGAKLRIVICDNCSSDQTLERIRQWAADHAASWSFAEGECGSILRADADLTLLRAPVNGGFAYGTNRALEVLLADPALDLFWLVNPDARAYPDTAAHYLAAASTGDFALMGGRTLFAERPGLVQTDGGRVSRLTGRCVSVNKGVSGDRAPMPEAQTLDFITGANCVASRAFLETAGLMEEDYFLYYEEVDWAFRRGSLPLRVVPNALMLHLGGTTIGTGTYGRRASPFANYFNYRNRMRFLFRFLPFSLPIGLAFALAEAAKLILLGGAAEARALLAGALGLGPPEAVRAKLDPAAQKLAFAEASR